MEHKSYNINMKSIIYVYMFIGILIAIMSSYDFVLSVLSNRLKLLKPFWHAKTENNWIANAVRHTMCTSVHLIEQALHWALRIIEATCDQKVVPTRAKHLFHSSTLPAVRVIVRDTQREISKVPDPAAASPAPPALAEGGKQLLHLCLREVVELENDGAFVVAEEFFVFLGACSGLREDIERGRGKRALKVIDLFLDIAAMLFSVLNSWTSSKANNWEASST